MRRILLIAAMLLPLTSAMAAVTITAVDEGHSAIGGVEHATIRIEYSADVNIRAFALDINVDNGTNIGDSIRDFNTGESIAPTKGYGIFPSRFRDFIDPQNPNWGDGNYMPVTAWDEPGAQNTGLGWPKMIVELGTLYSGDANQPDKSGTLFRFDVNSEGASDCYLRIASDDLRGGVVDEDAAGVTPATNSPLYIQFLVPPDAPTSITYPASDHSGRFTVSWVPAVTGGTADSFIVEKDLNGGGYAQVYNSANLSFLADAAVGSNTYRVKAHNGAGESGWTTGSACAVTWCFGSGVAGYAQWLLVGRPKGWCDYPRQCYGDADGKQQGKAPNTVWVGGNDLTILTNAWTKTAAQLYLAPDPNANADFDRKPQGKAPNIIQVGGNDLTIMTNNWAGHDPYNGNPPADCVH
jgi:hypothetical protein